MLEYVWASVAGCIAALASAMYTLTRDYRITDYSDPCTCVPIPRKPGLDAFVRNSSILLGAEANATERSWLLRAVIISTVTALGDAFNAVLAVLLAGRPGMVYAVGASIHLIGKPMDLYQRGEECQCNCFLLPIATVAELLELAALAAFLGGGSWYFLLSAPLTVVALLVCPCVCAWGRECCCEDENSNDDESEDSAITFCDVYLVILVTVPYRLVEVSGVIASAVAATLSGNWALLLATIPELPITAVDIILEGTSAGGYSVSVGLSCRAYVSALQECTDELAASKLIMKIKRRTALAAGGEYCWAGNWAVLAKRMGAPRAVQVDNGMRCRLWTHYKDSADALFQTHA